MGPADPAPVPASGSGAAAASPLDRVGGWAGVLGTLTGGGDLDPDRARLAMAEILAGEASPARIAAFIVALAMKGPAVAEVAAMVDAMLGASAPLELAEETRSRAIDIVGTGGSSTRGAALNVSTMAAFVAAGAGATVCKHGNRRVSSTSGSFDLLEELGVPVELDGPEVARCVEELGIGFCFARSFHPAMRHAGPVRAELGIPTVFNFLGPLSNPARVGRMVVGVSDPATAPTVIGVLRARGAVRALVVSGHDGMDELTTTAPSTVHELREGEVRSYEVTPEQAGLERAELAQVAGGDPATNAALARRILEGEAGPHRDLVLFNAGAGLVVAGLVDDLPAGVAVAAEAVDDGRALARLGDLVAFAGGLAQSGGR